MEIDKTFLMTMIREYWALNNEVCENTTILFLRKIGLSDKEIESWLDIRPDSRSGHIKDRNLKYAQEHLDNVIQETKWYYQDDE